MEALIGKALATVLVAGRAQFNQRFRAAQQQHRSLESEAWLDWMKNTLDPVAERVAAHEPGAVAAVVEALYDQALPLVAKRWLGGEAREPVLAAAYRELLIALAPALARDPARARHWAERLAQLGAGLADVDTVLGLGRVLAWRAGWPAHREAALEVAPRLPPALVQAALDLSVPPRPALWAALSAAPTLRADEVGTPAAREMRWLGWSGGFRGLGGPFSRLPVIGLAGGQLAASDGADTWRLAGDGYGTQALRMGASADWPVEPAAGPVRISSAGTVAAGALSRDFPEQESAAGWAWHAGLLTVTLRTSYQVALLRCPMP